MSSVSPTPPKAEFLLPYQAKPSNNPFAKGRIKFLGFSGEKYNIAVESLGTKSRVYATDVGRLERLLRSVGLGRIGVLKIQDSTGKELYYRVNLKSLEKALNLNKAECKEMRSVIKQGGDITEIVEKKIRSEQKSLAKGRFVGESGHLIRKEDDQAKFAEGMRLLQAGKNDKAKDYFEQIEDKNPEAAYQLGKIYHSEGEVKLGLEKFQKAADRGHPDALYEIGMELIKNGDPLGKERLAEAAIGGNINAMKELYRRHPELTVYLRMAARHGDKEASRELHKLNAENPPDNQNQALEDLELSRKNRIRVRPPSIELKGRLVTFPDTRAESIRAASPVLDQMPELKGDEGKKMAVIALDDNQYVKVRIKDLPDYIRKHPEFADALWKNGGDITSFVQERQFDLLQRRVDEYPVDESCLRLAHLLESRHSYREAVKYYEKMEQSHMPELIDESRERKAVIFEKAGLVKSAMEEYKKMTEGKELKDIDPKLLCKLGQSYELTGDVTTAELYYQIGTEKNDKEAMCFLGCLLAKSTNRKDIVSADELRTMISPDKSTLSSQDKVLYSKLSFQLAKVYDEGGILEREEGASEKRKNYLIDAMVDKSNYEAVSRLAAIKRQETLEE